MTINKALIVFLLFFGSAKAQSFIYVATPQQAAAATCASPPIFVSSHTAYFATVTSSDITVGSVQAGDWIQAAFISNVSAPTVPFVVTDNCVPTSTYTVRVKTANSPGPTTTQVFTASSNCTGSVKVSVTYPSSHDAGGHVVVARNVNAFDTSASGSEAGSGTTFNTGAFTTTQANDFYFSVLANENTAITAMTLTSSAVTLTKIADQPNNTSSSSYGISTSIQTGKTATYSWTGASTDGVGIIIASKGSCGI